MSSILNEILEYNPDKFLLAKEKAVEKYTSAGYELPTYTISLIKDVYNQIYEKENNRGYTASGDFVSEAVGRKIEMLRDITELKLINTLMDKFKSGEESVEFNFHRGIPDKETTDFFNLSYVSGDSVNISRTSEVRLPKSFGGAQVKDCCFTITPQGDNVNIDGKNYGIFDPVISDINSSFTNTESTQE